MTYDQDWIKDWPGINFVSFFDEDFEEVYKRHKHDLAAVIIDTVNWYKGINEIKNIAMIVRCIFIPHMRV